MNLFPPELKPLMDALHPHQLWLVGGASRAYLNQQPWPTDFDCCTTVHPEEMISAFESMGIQPDTSAQKFGCIRARVGAYDVEITTLRQDAYSQGSRYPQVMFTDSLEIDSHRRDFTINALYLNSEGDILDFYNGLSDFKNGVVRFIGNPADRLTEDPLRLVRYLRFVAQYGRAGHTLELEKILQEAQPLLKEISQNRLRRELQKLPRVSGEIQALAARILGEYFPDERDGDSAFFCERERV